eukprot:6534753-Pyramimonas_sp.AAC.1
MSQPLPPGKGSDRAWGAGWGLIPQHYAARAPAQTAAIAPRSRPDVPHHGPSVTGPLPLPPSPG